MQILHFSAFLHGKQISWIPANHPGGQEHLGGNSLSATGRELPASSYFKPIWEIQKNWVPFYRTGFSFLSPLS